MKTYTPQVLVIGAGPAGLAAAQSAAEHGAKEVFLLERDNAPGGILQQCIHMGFGLKRFNEELTGPEYAWRDVQSMKKYPQIKLFTQTSVLRAKGQTLFALGRQGAFLLKPKAIVLAMGCRERPRGALNIPMERPSGIFTAGTAQKLLNIQGLLVGKAIVIVGSGDIGLIMARRMTLTGAHVRAVFEQNPYPGGLRRNIVQCLDDFSIPLYTSRNVTKIQGRTRLEGVWVAEKNKNNQQNNETFIPCDTLLFSCGLIPENELSRALGLALCPLTNGPYVNQYRATPIPGIYACGNVLHVHDLVDFVSQEGEIAGKHAALYAQGRAYTPNHLRVHTAGPLRYALPHYIDTANMDGNVTFYMRVQTPVANATLSASLNERCIYTKKAIRFMPAEMIQLTLQKKTLEAQSGTLTFSLEGEYLYG